MVIPVTVPPLRTATPVAATPLAGAAKVTTGGAM